jgi:SSS family solute:Na+ symporter
MEFLTNGEFREDNAYSAVLGFLPAGLKGLSLAALTAAIVASLAGKANSISTIFTLDIYKKYIKKDAEDKKMVWIGRTVVIAALLLALLVNWNDALGIGGKGGFEFIQRYTGYISPAIFAVFILGFFWKRTTSIAAINGILCGFGLMILFDNYLPAIAGNNTFLYTAFADEKGHYSIPFLISMGWVFFFTALIMIFISLAMPDKKAHGMKIDKSMFKVSNSQIVWILLTLGILGALYIKFW